ncbi:MAG: hypothetical protein F4X79_10365 [Acidobacteria bacterium]|nr:hypothetical protein [Acidobacteriota bacterium]
MHDFRGVHILLELSGVRGEPVLKARFEEGPPAFIGLTETLGELRTNDPVPARGVTRDAAAVVRPGFGSILQVGDRALDGQILHHRFIRRRRRDGDLSEVILVQAVLTPLRVKLGAEKRNPSGQSDGGERESHNRSQSQEVLVLGAEATIHRRRSFAATQRHARTRARAWLVAEDATV